MKNEVMRQLVHLSGLFSIAFAQLAGGFAASVVFLLIALFFLAYSRHISMCEKSHRSLLSRIECKLRGFALSFERKEVKKPFIGAFWFYFGLGLAFLFFPLSIATAAGAILAVSDSLSTLVGVRFGKHKLIGKKSWEGTAMFFVSAMAVCSLLFPLQISIAAAMVATAAELLPEAVGRIDDNLLIPLLSGFTITIMMML